MDFMRLFTRFLPYLPAVALIATGIVANVKANAAPAEKKNEISVKRLVLAHGVADREPQEATTSFNTKDDRVYAFVEVENPTKSEDQIVVVFQPPSGPAHAEIPLKVGDSSRFRTWAFTRRVHEAGDWGVVVRDTHGRVLARQSFTVAR
jgi:hypothetical protein